ATIDSKYKICLKSAPELSRCSRGLGQMNEEQTNFKVTDRRLFNADGSPRDLPPEEKPEPQVSVAAEAAAAAKPAESQAQPEPAATSEATAEPEEELTEAELEEARDPASFVAFVM